MLASTGDSAPDGTTSAASDPPATASPVSPTPDSARKPLLPLVILSQVAPERMRWLSPGRIAAGKITILDGDPGTGKSILLCEFAARITCGDPLPGGEASSPRRVILLSAEDDLYDTIRPRIDAAGGDPHRVIVFTSPPENALNGTLGSVLDHVHHLEAFIPLAQVALVIIDPLVAFLSRGRSANSDQSVRRAFHALKGLAERTGVAIVAVRHLNKSQTANALYRGGGSIGIIGAARCGLLLAPDPDDPERRILASTKTNLGLMAPSLAFRLQASPGQQVARIVWDGESEWTADQLLRESAAGVASHSLLAEAREWLRTALASGPRPAREILSEARDAGIGRDLLYAVRKVEGVRIGKERVAGGRWVWSIPTPEGELPGIPSPLEVQEVQEVRSDMR